MLRHAAWAALAAVPRSFPSSTSELPAVMLALTMCEFACCINLDWLARTMRNHNLASALQVATNALRPSVSLKPAWLDE